jgi:hypothetical protein
MMWTATPWSPEVTFWPKSAMIRRLDEKMIRPSASLALVLLASTGCGSSPAPTPVAPSSPYIKLTLLPNILDAVVPFSMGVGDSLQLRANGWTNSFTFTDITATAHWQTSMPGVIGVSSAGTVTGVSPGIGDVAAASQSVSSSARFRVFGREDIENFQAVMQDHGPFIPGNVTSSQAIVSLRDGTRLDVGQWFASWMSSDPSVASVSSTGGISLIGAGIATITAGYQGRASAASVTVVPVKPGEDALQDLTGGIGRDPSNARGLTFDETVSYNIVSGPIGTITLLVTDRSGTNIGADPPVSRTFSRGAGAVTLRDTFVVPPGVTDACRTVTLVIPTSGVRLAIPRACTPAPGT